MNEGTVRWDPAKSLWFGSVAGAALILGPWTFTPSAGVLFALTTAATLCLGHSVGIHRGLIHRSFRGPPWLERLLVYLGVLVGLGGPLGLLRMHEGRDREQNQPDCHDYFAHRRSPWVDYLWNLHCRFDFQRPPAVQARPDVEEDPFYRFLERTWRWQQLPWAVLLFLAGGLPFLVWGTVVRIAVGTFGHWLVGYVCHRQGERRWHNRGAAVQGWNSPWLGALSMGEGWHNNHHAFPCSARLGLAPGEWDPGWVFLSLLARWGLIHGVLTPEDASARAASTEEEHSVSLPEAEGRLLARGGGVLGGAPPHRGGRCRPATEFPPRG